MGKVEQDVQNKAAVNKDLADLDDALGKIVASTPAASDLETMVKTLKTWADVRVLVETAVPEKGPTAKLPTGKVPLIYDPELEIGKAIVLGNGGVLIGNAGRGPLSITMGNAAEALGLPIVTGNPLPSAQGQEMTSGVLLINPPDSRGTVNYNVNGNLYVSEPGMEQRLADGRWVVEYDRGEKGGTSSYTVESGTYYFAPTDNGWQLYRERFDVTLDNTNNPEEFNFVFQGAKMTVPANGTLPLHGSYPLVVRFDRGNGTDLAVKMIKHSGTVEVGVNTIDNLWDLFPTAENQREVNNLKLFRTP
jgi:hypothetical protein